MVVSAATLARAQSDQSHDHIGGHCSDLAPNQVMFGEGPPCTVLNDLTLSLAGGQKLGRLQPFIDVFPHKCTGKLAYFGPS